MPNLTDYTEAEIDALQEGRETDALVAEFVMGWEGFGVYGPVQSKLGDWMVQPIPEFSKEISAAWAIGERMAELGQRHYYSWALNRLILSEADERNEFMGEADRNYALSQATPLQRCKTALKTIRAQRIREAGNV